MADEEFQPGDVVWHKSVGLPMTVVGIRTEEDVRRAETNGMPGTVAGVYCKWNVGIKIQVAHFQASSLKRTSGE